MMAIFDPLLIGHSPPGSTPRAPVNALYE